MDENESRDALIRETEVAEPATAPRKRRARERTSGAIDPAAPPGADDSFRREAALAILGAFVMRHGGFTLAEREVHMRLVWETADAFVALEHAGPLPPPEPPPEDTRPRQRPVSPTDEWAVVDGDRTRKGFVTREEAEWYASARPGAVVKQVSGTPHLVADPNVE